MPPSSPPRHDESAGCRVEPKTSTTVALYSVEFSRWMSLVPGSSIASPELPLPEPEPELPPPEPEPADELGAPTAPPPSAAPLLQATTPDSVAPSNARTTTTRNPEAKCASRRDFNNGLGLVLDHVIFAPSLRAGGFVQAVEGQHDLSG